MEKWLDSIYYTLTDIQVKIAGENKSMQFCLPRSILLDKGTQVNAVHFEPQSETSEEGYSIVGSHESFDVEGSEAEDEWVYDSQESSDECSQQEHDSYGGP